MLTRPIDEGDVETDRTAAVPDAGLASDLVSDLELALLGVLPAGQLLGGPVPGPTAGEERPGTGASADLPSHILLPLPDPLAADVLSAGAGLLRDEEWTPVARLLVSGQAVTGPGGRLAVPGVLEPVRHREAGFGRAHALSSADRDAGGGRHLVVLRRPPVGAERDRLRAAAAEHPLLIVVSTGPGGPDDLPARLLVGVARDLLVGLATGRASVLTAPLAWRDPASDAALARRLRSWSGAAALTYLTPEGPDDGDAAWRSLAEELERGQCLTLPGVSEPVRALLLGWRPPRHRRGLVLMFTGLSGSGKSTVARDVSERLRAAGRTVSLLDGDVVRTLLSAGLGFDRTSRERNVERIGFVAAEVARHGGVAVCAPIAPYAAGRDGVRRMAQAHGGFVLVHVDTPLAECERRDLKGLYAQARAGLISEFTGISDPYEEPTDADLRVDTSRLAPDEATASVLRFLTDAGWLTENAT